MYFESELSDYQLFEWLYDYIKASSPAELWRQTQCKFPIVTVKKVE